MPYATLEDYFADSSSLRLGKLLRVPKLGKKTADEFDKLVAEFAKDRSHDLLRGIDHRGANLHAGAAIPSGEANSKHEITDRYHTLSPRERDVLERRFGIGREKKQTLEEIGDDYDVTRERIRQIQAKALRKLKSPYIARLWEEFANENFDNLVIAVFGSKPLIKRPREVLGEQALAIAVVFGKTSKFLEQKATRIDGFWLRPNIDALELQSARNRLISHLREEGSLPQSASEISNEIGTSRRVLEAAVSMLSQFSQYDGWIVDGKATARKKRTVNILNLFHRSYVQSPVSLWDLKVAYWANYSDKCSGRDLLICLQEHKAHFISLRELGWLCLTVESIMKRHEPTSAISYDHIPDELFAKPVKTGRGLANSVYQLFDTHGPLRLANAAELFQKEYPRYSVSSMYPMLVYYAVFLRLAPGVIGIQSHCRDPETFHSARQLLLRERDVDLYLLSRATGPPLIKYPLWDPVMERLWAGWLEDEQDHDRLGSLLEVADINRWGLDQQATQEWEHKKHSLGRPITPPEIHLLSQRRIEIGILVTALAAATVYGFVNWMFLNQSLGWRVETTRVGLVLAILVRIGALKPTGAWSEPHLLTKRGREIGRSLLSQPSGDFNSALDLFEEPDDRKFDFKWVDTFNLAELLQQVAEFSQQPDSEYEANEEPDYGEDLPYDGLMGDALRLLIEGD